MNIRNNLLLSIRHLRADRINTLINIAGLILGLGIVSVVIVFVVNELGYNSSFKNRANIYRVLNYNSADNNPYRIVPNLYYFIKTKSDKLVKLEFTGYINANAQYGYPTFSIVNF